MKRLRLIQLNQREIGSIHYLIKPEVYVGRASTNDIVVNQKQISRRHLLIRLEPDGVSATVEDCGSANGAFLNGDMIEGAAALVPGATLTIGDIDFRVELMDAEDDADFDTLEKLQNETHGTVDLDDYESPIAATATRNAELDGLGVRSCEPDESLDQVAQIASTLFGVGTGFVSVVGESTCYYRGAFGLAEREWSRNETPCGLVVEAHAPIWVGELFPDERILALPFLNMNPPFRFYAGAPYCGPSGIVIGTVGVISEKALAATPTQLDALNNLAKFVERQITLELEKKRANELHMRLVEIEEPSSDDTI